MKNKSAHSFNNIIITLSLSLFGLLLVGCSSTSEMRVSQYKFIYQGQSYLLRSAYCPNNPKSCNQIICKEFVANDLNQDRIIDEVINSDIPLSKVQKIYDYCLNALEKQGKVNKIDLGNNNFTYSENSLILDIKSFVLDSTNLFNQFTIKEKFSINGMKITVFLDREADGKLDETLKGDFNFTAGQKKYIDAINKGLNEGKLKKINNHILCM